MSPPLIGPCMPENGKPDHHEHLRLVVMVILAVMLFSGALLALGHSVETALLSAGAAGLMACEVARRALGQQPGEAAA